MPYALDSKLKRDERENHQVMHEIDPLSLSVIKAHHMRDELNNCTFLPSSFIDGLLSASNRSSISLIVRSPYLH